MTYTKSTMIVISLAAGLGGAFALADSDRLGKKLPIDLAVAEQRVNAHFESVDADDNELITLAEFQAQPYPEGKGNIGGLTDKQRANYKANREVHKAAFEAEMFDVMDLNKDGTLSREEASRENRQIAKFTLARGYRFNRLDTNGDGLLSRSEFSVRLETLMNADANADGEINNEEAIEARKALRRLSQR